MAKHALLTVVSLATVNPDRICVFDLELGGREVVGGVGSNGDTGVLESWSVTLVFSLSNS